MSANTYATLIKEIMAKMPDNLEDKKEVDLYYKNAMKEVKEKINEDKKVAKAAPAALAAPKKGNKRVKKVEYDDDGNEIVKEKKPLTKYLKFIQDNRQKIKDENPNLSSKEYMVLLANLWNKHKEDTKVNKADDETEDNTDDADDIKKDDDVEDDIVDDDADDADDKKDNKEKKAKQPKQLKQPKKAKQPKLPKQDSN
jgi:hypothetical protein